ncbi:MAG: superoxide dismutase, Ni [Desulfobulbaceae bacterium]|nr:superoxide dismutase, Ni [Desulfobulbaceae bacterium]
MKKIVFVLLTIAACFAFSITAAQAHCEIPCGIYDDQARLSEIAEHIQTIEKSMNQIMALQKEGKINYNQLVRWVNNKETHAGYIQEIASQYFLTQRIKFDTENYDKMLAALHRIIVYAMKCKQTTDLENAANLRNSLHDFEHLYLGKK